MTTPIPSEFVSFVREIALKAFDKLSSRSKDLEAPLRNFIRSWARLSNLEKSAFFDELIAAAQMPDAPAQETAAAAKQRAAVKRYDPETVAATLPKKTPSRTKMKAKKKPK